MIDAPGICRDVAGKKTETDHMTRANIARIASGGTLRSSGCIKLTVFPGERMLPRMRSLSGKMASFRCPRGTTRWISSAGTRRAARCTGVGRIEAEDDPPLRTSARSDRVIQRSVSPFSRRWATVRLRISLVPSATLTMRRLCHASVSPISLVKPIAPWVCMARSTAR